MDYDGKIRNSEWIRDVGIPNTEIALSVVFTFLRLVAPRSTLVSAVAKKHYCWKANNLSIKNCRCWATCLFPRKVKKIQLLCDQISEKAFSGNNSSEYKKVWIPVYIPTNYKRWARILPVRYVGDREHGPSHVCLAEVNLNSSTIMWYESNNSYVNELDSGDPEKNLMYSDIFAVKTSFQRVLLVKLNFSIH